MQTLIHTVINTSNKPKISDVLALDVRLLLLFKPIK